MQHEADVRAWMGDWVGCRRVCRAMLERFGSTSDPVVARRTFFACLLEADAIPDRRMLPRLLEQFRGDPAIFSAIAEALYEYREGRFAAALEILGRFSEAKALASPEFDICCIIRAMAHARLGQADEARRQFAMAGARPNQVTFDPSGEGPLPGKWWDWLRYYTLRREAEGLLPRSDEAVK
jgi:hypothetical protein